jgi:hypothetical protein
MTGFNFHDEIAKAKTELVDVVERKVKAATTAATATALVVSVLGLYVFHGVVPDWATVAIGSTATGVLTAAAGYLAKHTPRTPPPAATPLAPAPGPVPPVA